LFRWDDVPGKDSKRLLKFLKDDLKIGWAENAKIKKSDDSKAISFTKESNTLTFKLNGEEKKAILELCVGETYEYILKEENGNLKIYEKSNENILGDKVGFQINNKLENNLWKTYWLTFFRIMRKLNKKEK